MEKKFQKKKREKGEIIFVISPTAQHLPKKKVIKKKNYWTHTGFGIDNRIGSISKNSHFVILGWGREGAKKKIQKIPPKNETWGFENILVRVSRFVIFFCFKEIQIKWGRGF